MSNTVCAAIVTYNIGKDLIKCFCSIKDQVAEVVFVDNGSGEETLRELRNLQKTFDRIKVFYNQKNMGIAAALNSAVKYAIEKGHTWILTMDHDSEATPGMVEKMQSVFTTLVAEGVPKVRIVAPIPFDTNINSSLIETISTDNRYDLHEVRRVISSGSMIDLHVFQEVGYFNEKLFMYYVDDEFCLRCRNNKCKIYVCNSAILLHREGAKERKRFFWKRIIYRKYDYCAMYYRSRNLLHMIKKHHEYEKDYYRHFILICQAIKHICFEAGKIILFDNNRLQLLYFMMKGILDGFAGKYGQRVG